MAKALKVIGTIAGVVALTVALPGVGAAIGISAATAGTVATVASVVAVAANIGAGALYKPPKSYTSGSVSNVVIAANQPTPYLIGETYSEGIEQHDVGYGGTVDKVSNPYRFRARVYSGCGPVQQLVSTMVNFSTVSFSGTAASGYYSGFMYRDFQLGATPEADALAPQWGGAPNWGTDYKLSGYAAIGWSMKFDKEGKKWASGDPRLGTIWQGVKVYDPRLDTTYPGGSGAHRINNEATWAYSENPALHALAYAYGRYTNGKKVFGVDLGDAAIDVASFVAWANVCDTNGWTIGGTIYEPGDKWNNLKQICEAGAAKPVLRGGVLTVMFSSSKVSLDTITAADLADGEISITASQRWKERINGIVPKFRSPDHQWNYEPVELVTSATYVTEDGEDKIVERQWDLVQDADQVSQLAAYAVADSREFFPITLRLKPRLIAYRPGDPLTINLPDQGLSSQLCVVLSRSVDPGTGEVELTFVSETTAKHAFALGKTGTAPPTPSLTSAEARDGTVKINLAKSSELYDAGTQYDLGRIVALADRSTWLYINATATTGNSPFVGSAYWLQLSPPLAAADINVEDGATVGAILGPSGNLLLEDGTTKGTDAGLVTADGTAAFIADQGDLATKNDVDLTSTDVSNGASLSQWKVSPTASTGLVILPNYIKKTGASGWNASAITHEKLGGGCLVSGTIASISSTGCSIGLIAADAFTNATNEFAQIDFAITQENSALRVHELGSLKAFVGGISEGDTYQVRYAGDRIEYLHNGAIFYTTITTAGRSFRGGASLDDTGSVASNLNFTTYGSGSFIDLSDGTEISQFRADALNTGSLLILPAFIKKVGTNNGWNAAAISYDKYKAGCLVSGVIKSITGTIRYKVGLIDVDAFTASPSKANQIDYAIYQNNTDIRISENASDRGSFGTAAVGDAYEIRYAGTTLEYLINGTVVRTVTTTAGRSFRAAAVFEIVGSQAGNLNFTTYADGVKLDTVSANADETSANTAAFVAGQTDWATYAGSTTRVVNLSDVGDFNSIENITARALSLLTGRAWTNLFQANGSTPISDASALTALGTSLYVNGQGTGATANSLADLNATDGTKLSGIETAADVTSAINGLTAMTVEFDSTGTAKTGQLPKTATFKLIRNGTEITSSVAWSVAVIEGTGTASISGTGSGLLSVNTLPSNSKFRLTAVYAGTTRTWDVTATRQVDAPPPPSGGGTSQSDTSLAGWNGSFVTISDELTVDAGSVGTVDLSVNFVFNSTAATPSIETFVKFQKWNGSSWVDIGTTKASDPDCQRSYIPDFSVWVTFALGVISHSYSDTAPAPNDTGIKYRLQAYASGNGCTAADANFTATGS